MSLLEKFEKEQLKQGIPDFRPGDTVKVHVRITEGEKVRIQIFQGVVIRRRGGGRGASFTVRKISYGVGVERIFPLHSPAIDHVDIVQRGHVRRARLYYLRKLRGKKARIRVKRFGVSKPELIVADEAPPPPVEAPAGDDAAGGADDSQASQEKPEAGKES